MVYALETKIIYICPFYALLVFKTESHALGSKSLVVYQATYRVTRGAGENVKRNYANILLIICFIRLQKECVKDNCFYYDLCGKCPISTILFSRSTVFQGSGKRSMNAGKR
jgi:hypothetical protein